MGATEADAVTLMRVPPSSISIWWIACLRTSSMSFSRLSKFMASFHFLDIARAARVDLEHVAFGDVEGNLHHQTCLELGRLAAAARGIALDVGLGLDDLQLDEVGNIA